MAVERHFPSACPALAPFVRRYTLIRLAPERDFLRVVPARADLFLQILITGDQAVRDLRRGAGFAAPEVTMIGPCTAPWMELRMRGPVELFLVQLQPSALFLLTGLDMRMLLDVCIDASTVVSVDPAGLVGQMRRAATDAARVAVADEVIGGLFARAGSPDAVGVAAQKLRDSAGAHRIEALVRMSGLSHRQFQRRFSMAVGIAPKAYARMCRLGAVIEAHESNPARSWADLAAEFGFADQAHLTREFRELTQQLPSRFVQYREG